MRLMHLDNYFTVDRDASCRLCGLDMGLEYAFTHLRASHRKYWQFLNPNVPSFIRERARVIR